jgi:hypothetical protein
MSLLHGRDRPRHHADRPQRSFANERKMRAYLAAHVSITQPVGDESELAGLGMATLPTGPVGKPCP